MIQILFRLLLSAYSFLSHPSIPVRIYKALPFQALSGKRGSREEGPKGQGEPNERMAKSSPCQMGM